MSSPVPPIAPDRFQGKRLGKYEVLCRLGQGGMSQIFLARQKGVGGFLKLVVLKQVLSEAEGEEDAVRMFVDEARITAAFSHPNIAQVYDLDIADDELFLAMEFVQGATLLEVAQVLQAAGEDIPEGLTLASVRDAALALHYAHTFRDAAGRSRAVIHRDVAQKNIMVTYEGTTKLLDFGIAKAAGRATRTAPGRVKGTTGYMSPEQVLGEDLDPRSDVFSLGVVLHECLTGLRLYYDKDPRTGMLRVLESAPPAPSALKPGISKALDGLVMKALGRERRHRFDSALEFARELERVAPGRLWLPEQAAGLLNRRFRERQQQIQDLLGRVGEEESTRNVSITGLLQRRRKAPRPDPLAAQTVLEMPAAREAGSPGRKRRVRAAPAREAAPEWEESEASVTEVVTERRAKKRRAPPAEARAVRLDTRGLRRWAARGGWMALLVVLGWLIWSSGLFARGA